MGKKKKCPGNNNVNSSRVLVVSDRLKLQLGFTQANSSFAVQTFARAKYLLLFHCICRYSINNGVKQTSTQNAPEKSLCFQCSKGSYQ